MKIEYRHLNWMQLVWDTKLTTKAKIVCCALTSHMNANHHIAWPSIDRLARMTGQSEKTVDRAIKEIKDAGWLSIQPGGINKGTNRYTPIFPPSVEAMLGTHSLNAGVTKSQATDSETLVLGSQSPTNQSIESDNNNKGVRADTRDPDPPENLNRKAWDEFDEHRKSSAKLRKGWSAIAKRKTMNLLAKHSATDQQKLVDYSIGSGYPSIYPDQLTKGQPRNGTANLNPELAASHKPFADPTKQTKADKAKAQADLDRMQAQIAARQGPDRKRKQIAACRFPENLTKLCRHYGWGDPPAGLEFTEAKAWATQQAAK